LIKLGIGTIAFSPLAQGMLSDKYLKGIPKASRASDPKSALDKGFITKRNIKIISDLIKLQKKEVKLYLKWLWLGCSIIKPSLPL
jgi:L-glyceraldehyde 3-phosphate reductase